MKQVFPIVPATSGPFWVFLALAVFLLAIVALIGFIAWSSRHVKFEVGPEGLRIRGDVYGRLVPFEDLDVAGASVVDLTLASEFRPKSRTNGTGLPGYSAGWFRLESGEKALVFVTDKTRVLRVPTRKGYSLLLAPTEPDSLLAALRVAEGGSR